MSTITNIRHDSQRVRRGFPALPSMLALVLIWLWVVAGEVRWHLQCARILAVRGLRRSWPDLLLVCLLGVAGASAIVQAAGG